MNTKVQVGKKIRSLRESKQMEIEVLAERAQPFLYCEWLQRDKQHALQIDGYRIFRHASARYLLYALLLIILCLFSGQVQTFIYFQF